MIKNFIESVVLTVIYFTTAVQIAIATDSKFVKYELKYSSDNSQLVQKRWPMPISAELPGAVGDFTVQVHPENLYKVKIYKVTDGKRNQSILSKHEYSEHQSLSSDGNFLITHGIETRDMYSGIAPYSRIRSVSPPDGGFLRDWQWSPVHDSFAYYFNNKKNTFVQYNAVTNEHSVLWDATGKVLTSTDGDSFSNLRIGHRDTDDGPMGGQGSISLDGSRIAFKTYTGADAVIVVFDVPTRMVVGSFRIRNGADQKTGLDTVSISPLGDYIFYSISKVGTYIVSTSRLTEEGAQPVLDVGHKDLIQDENGNQFVLGVIHKKVEFETGRASEFFSSSHRNYHAKHIGATNKRDGHFVLSGYCSLSPAHCDVDAPHERENMLLIGNINDDKKYAWFGWTTQRVHPINYDRSYWIHQPHANINMDVKYNLDGSVLGPKVVFTGVNADFRSGFGDIYVVEYLPHGNSSH